MFDVEMIPDVVVRAHMKRLAIETCASFLGRTISQSEFRVKNGKSYEKDELYYRLNVRPNKNMTASTFWQTVVRKLIYDNECLIIQADDEDLLIADDYEHSAFAVKEDIFSKVKLRGYEFQRVFKQNEVLHLRYTNEKLTPLIDGLFADYGELFARILNAQKRKNQIRGTVDMDMLSAKTPEHLQKFQEFIDNMYKAIGEKDIAIVPQQKGTKYDEKYDGAANGPSVDEINKVTNGFLDQVAMALGIHISLIRGDLADVEKHTKNFMMFTVSPLLKKIGDEGNSKFLTKEEYLDGRRLDIRQVSYQSVFDLANSIDKLISSGAFTGNELRDEAGWERSDDPKLDKHYITKNYQEMYSAEGGDDE
ncbi:phage portal protein [Rossellomorea aquimaris]|uniref:phage portal protein n=1 Tax=Rossellomorea aquimaris TaxID=189382 RepID=UPI001CD516FD|nr:phage portal protein [Rossellomorea aquimaris]MCA1058110.1 phage portal protein [Rossellomorea aquimaris]